MVKNFRDDHWNGFTTKLLPFVRDEHNKVQTSMIFFSNLTTTVNILSLSTTVNILSLSTTMNILSLSTTMNILSHFVNNFEHQVERLLGKSEYIERQWRILVSREVLDIRDSKANSLFIFAIFSI